MRQPVYTLYPGSVYSRTDGQKHFVGRNELARLYNVPLDLCLTIEDRDLRRPDLRDHVSFAGKLIALRPREDGDYRLPQTLNGTTIQVQP